MIPYKNDVINFVVAWSKHGHATGVPSVRATGGNTLRNAMLHGANGRATVPSGHATGEIPLEMLCCMEQMVVQRSLLVMQQEKYI